MDICTETKFARVTSVATNKQTNKQTKCIDFFLAVTLRSVHQLSTLVVVRLLDVQLTNVTTTRGSLWLHSREQNDLFDVVPWWFGGDARCAVYIQAPSLGTTRALEALLFCDGTRGKDVRTKQNNEFDIVRQKMRV